ncbi:MAG: alpha/beta hydrolase-fold protein [Xanthomonadales bacterium]|jgi:enterochelin esterase family protein|nr:alpha/beta hydrolase-fold protein [Xanthomonadales bacterium]
MNPDLRKLLRKRALDDAAVDAFLAAHRFPLVDEESVTFVYRGEADAIYLHIWISGLDTAQPFQALGKAGLWAATIDLPKGSRIEYKLEVERNGQRELIVDPLNPVLAHDPFGANSVCQGWGYERPDWTLENKESRRGRLETLPVRSRAFGEIRAVDVYLPANYRDNRPLHLLMVHDGGEYRHFAALQTVLDNLVHRLEIPPMLVAMTQSPDRLNEYAGNDRHADFLAGDLLPALQARYPLLDAPEHRGLMGASFGGVASLHAAWRHPGLWGRLLLQSGSFAFSDIGRHRRGPVFDPVVKFMNAFREAPGRPAERMYLSCGIYESLIYENRSLLPRLQDQGIDVTLEEVRDAHNWENWRDRLRNGLSWLFPGPQWIVYE